MMPLPSPADRHLSAPALAARLGALSPAGPTYVALADALRRSVLDGAVPLSTRLPSERELASALGLSRTTTASAYERLREQGYLRTRRGSGSVTTLPRRRADGEPTLAGTDDPGTIDLTIAAPAAPPGLHPAVLRALDRLPAHLDRTGYSRTGLPELRALLAELYTRRGTPTTPEEVLVTSGAQHAIALLAAVLLSPGDRAVVEHPTYPHAVSAIRSRGARAVPVPVGRAGVDLELLESTIRQTSPRMAYLVPDHHNPTGVSLSDVGRLQVRHLAARHRTVVVADETLSDLTLEGPGPSPFAGSEPHAHVVSVGSMSKSWWGGLRVGWVRGHRELVARLAAERSQLDLGTSVLDQLVACELLGDPEAEVAGGPRIDGGQDRAARERGAFGPLPAGRLSLLREQRDALVAGITRTLPWEVAVPSGGLGLWVDLGAPVSSALAAVAPAHGVRLSPGPVFAVDGSFEDRLRLPYSLPVPALQEAVTRLAAAWAALGPVAGAGATEARSGVVV